MSGPECKVCGGRITRRSSTCSAKCDAILTRYPSGAILADARQIGVSRTLGKHPARSAARRYAERIIYEATMAGQL